jgi:hypothetical protein
VYILGESTPCCIKQLTHVTLKEYFFPNLILVQTLLVFDLNISIISLLSAIRRFTILSFLTEIIFLVILIGSELILILFV